jgi:subtilisin family serine protease
VAGSSRCGFFYELTGGASLLWFHSHRSGIHPRCSENLVKMLRPRLTFLALITALSGCLFGPGPTTSLTGRIWREHTPTSTTSFAATSTDEMSAGPGRLLVGFAEGTDGFTSQTASSFELLAHRIAADRPEVSLHRSFPQARIAVYDVVNMRAAASEIRTRPGVRYVEEDVQLSRLVDEHRDKQWPLDIIDVDSAWTAGGTTGIGTRVAIIDVGFQSGHPDLQESYSYSFTFRKSSLEENPGCNSHGMHVAGIAAAVAGNTIGVAGVAPGSDLTLLDVTGDNDPKNPCPIAVSTLIAALDWVTGSESTGPNADVVNISLGTPTYSQPLHDAIFQAFKKGVTIVAASGNYTENVLYPAAFPEVIAVSATGPDDRIAGYSTTGPEVFVSAPGGNSTSDLDLAKAVYSTLYDGTEHTYSYMQGTSMASPAAAGVAALVRSLNPKLSPVDIANVLRWSSTDLGDTGWDSTFGFGRIDAASAANRAKTFAPSSVSYRLTSSAGHDVLLPFDGEFELTEVPGGDVTLTVKSDDNGNGVFGELGEYSGSLTVSVDTSGTNPYRFVPAYRVE